MNQGVRNFSIFVWPDGISLSDFKKDGKLCFIENQRSFAILLNQFSVYLFIFIFFFIFLDFMNFMNFKSLFDPQ